MRAFRIALGFLAFLLPVLYGWPTVQKGYPFWYDEVYTAQFVTLPVPLGAMLQRIATEDSNPPLGYLVYRALGGLLVRPNLHAPSPGAEVRLRALSLVFVGTSALLLYAALLRAGLSPLYALAGALTLGLSPLVQTQGLEVRGYAFALAALSLGLYALSARHLPLGGLALLLAGGTHYLAGVLLGLVLVFGFGVRVLLYALPLLLWAPFALRALTKLGELQPWIEAFAPFFPLALLSMGYPLEFKPWSLLFGALLWLAALLSRLRHPLLLYHLFLLGLLPLLTGFTGQNPRYLILLLPVLVYGAGLFRKEVLLVLALFSLFLPREGDSYFRSISEPASQAIAAQKEGRTRILGCNLPWARTAEYYCRTCEVRVGTVPPEGWEDAVVVCPGRKATP